MFWMIILLTVGIPLAGQIHPLLLFVLSIPLMIWGFWGMYTAKRDLKAYRNGELIIDSHTGRAVPNPDHPKYCKRPAGSHAAAAAGMAGAGASAFGDDSMDSGSSELYRSAPSAFDDTDSADESSLHSESFRSDMDEMAINPANGMPMVGGTGGVDIEGNPYGTDNDVFADDHSVFDDGAGCGMDDSFSFHDDTFGCGIDDSMGSGFDDW